MGGGRIGVGRWNCLDMWVWRRWVGVGGVFLEATDSVCEGHGTKVPFMGSDMENVLLLKMELRTTC